MREKIFEEYMVERVLKSHGQKRTRMVLLNEKQEVIDELDKRERKRLRKEEKIGVEAYKQLLADKIPIPNVY